jgi:hypothetical protein
LNAADVIFGLVCPKPFVPDFEEEEILEWPVEMFLQLRDALRDQALVRMGLDPREYSFESDDIPWGPGEEDPEGEWAVELISLKPGTNQSANRGRSPNAG